MKALKPQPTAADYVVIAVTPALIVTLVTSLVFFLIEVFYLGQYDARLQFIMAMFVLAAVCVARISIEQGREYAALFAIPLAIVTVVATIRFVEYPSVFEYFSLAVNIGLIAVIWWCADKLTWDCTVINRRADTSGQGLLETVGIDMDDQPSGGIGGERRGDVAAVDRSPPIDDESSSVWRKFLGKRRRPHASGVWVIYFSIAALPIFGIGQAFVPVRDLDRRRFVFFLLAVYVASALALLLTTSILGMRRYLRQRLLDMPIDMLKAWFVNGILLIGLLMIVCLLLPRRNPEYSITHLPFFASSPGDLSAARFGFGSDGPVDENEQEKTRNGQAGGPSGRQPIESHPSNERTDPHGDRLQKGPDAGDKHDGNERDSHGNDGHQRGGNEHHGERDTPNSTENGGRQGEEQSEERSGQAKADRGTRPSADDRDNKSQAESARHDNRRSPRASREGAHRQSNMSLNVGGMLKLLYWLVVIALIAFACWRYRHQVIKALHRFIRALLGIWNRLFGRSEGSTNVSSPGSIESSVTFRRFADFTDPFASGMVEQWSPETIIKYSFEALQAWGNEHGCTHWPEQTAREYANEIARREKSIQREARLLADLYSQSNYGRGPTSIGSIRPIQDMWTKLSELSRGP